jgi:hypothetical protein
MPYTPALLVHILGGTVGMLSGAAAIVSRKGSRGHALAGRVFVVSMLIMGVMATYLAIRKHDPNNIGGGIIAVYMIGTAWLTARRRHGGTNALDWVLLLIPLGLGTLSWWEGIEVLRSGATSVNGVPVGMTFFMGTILLLAAAGDVQMLAAGGIMGVKRIARHLWRMCFGLFIAAGSFFMGPNNRPLRLLSAMHIGQLLPQALFSMGLYLLLTVLPLFLLVFWLIRIRFTGFYKRKLVPKAAVAAAGAADAD